MKLNFKLAVFDLDGVIADTEPLHREAKLRIMRKLNLSNSVDLDKHIGRPNSELWNTVIAENGIALSAAELERMQYDSILDQFVENDTKVSSGLLGLLDFLNSSSVSCAVCSSSDRYYVDKVLKHFMLTDKFSVIVGGDEVPEKKPAPDGYKLVVRRAGIDADSNRVFAIEDTSAGIKAAVAAGIPCVGYRNPTSGNQDLSSAFIRVESLDDITAWLKNNGKA